MVGRNRCREGIVNPNEWTNTVDRSKSRSEGAYRGGSSCEPCGQIVIEFTDSLMGSNRLAHLLRYFGD